jgi:addiction module HigA family antidote
VGLSAYALAKALSVPLPRLTDIVREKRSISPKMAVLLSAYFGTSDGCWFNLQAHFDLEMAREKVGKQASRIWPHPTTIAAHFSQSECRRSTGNRSSRVDQKSTGRSPAATQFLLSAVVLASAPTTTSSTWRRIQTGTAGSGDVEFPSNSRRYKWVRRRDRWLSCGSCV